MYLLDTNVVSELRKPRPHGAVLAWLESVEPVDLYLSALTLGELQAGVMITAARDPAKAAEIEAWIEEVEGAWNVLALNGSVCREWARLVHRKPDQLWRDAMIAATAIVHELLVVTRDRDFETLGVPTLDPFRYQPPS